MEPSSGVRHPLQDLFAGVARGIYPPADMRTEAMLRPPGVLAAALAFTAHCIVAADVDPAWVAERCPPGDLLAPMSPAFLTELGARVGASSDAYDLVFCAPAVKGQPELPLQRLDDGHSHPRIRRAMRLRRDVRVYGTPDGGAVLTIGRGLADRWEASFEVMPERRNRGLGRALVATARTLIPPDEAVFMQIAGGNVASIRAVLAGGLVPIGAEMLFHGETLC